MNVDPEFEALLRQRGATDDDIAEAARGGQHLLNALAAELMILPPAVHDLADVALAVGVDVATVAAWWRGLGFADPSAGRVTFTDDDITALKTIAALAGLLPTETVGDLIRAFGLSAQQLAHAGVNALRIGFEQPLRQEGGSDTDIEVAYADIVNEVVPDVVETWGTLFRRHIVASVYEDVSVSADGFVQSLQTIMFVDLVDFTGLAQRLEPPGLAELLSNFESSVSSVASHHGGRLVKLLGDGAMVRFGHRDDAIAAAREIVRSGEGPTRRVGVATGHVLTRQGDFYGPVVNLAARLSAVVAGGEVAIDGSSPVDDAELMAPVKLKGIADQAAYYRL